jgi:hypothetical protein
MAKQFDALNLRSLSDIVKANHKVLAVEPNLLAPTDHLTLTKNRDQRQLFTGMRRSHDRAHIVSGLW